MKTMMKGALIAASLFAAAPALAQTGPVVTLDLSRVLGESLAGKSGVSQLQAKYSSVVNGQQAAFNAAATTYNTQIEAARKLVKPDGSGLPDAQRATLADSEQKVRAADETLGRTRQEINVVNDYVRDQIIRALTPIAEQIRAERRATAVIPRGSVLAADPTTDVTTIALQRLDAAFKTVSITPPQQQPGRPATATTPQGR